MSDYPNRCQHLKTNGTQCGSPALRRNRFCYFHKRYQDERIRLNVDRRRRGTATFVLPVLEDANSIQMSLMQIMRLLLTGQIEHKTASLLLYALQTASTNLRMTNFKPLTNDVILDPRDVANTPLEEHIWEDDDFDQDKTEAETAADRAIEELETVRLEKEEKAKWRLWAERQYPDPFKMPPASVTPAGNAVIASEATNNRPLPNLSKPASDLKPNQIRAEISDMVRNQFLPAMSKKFAPAAQPNQPKEETKTKMKSKEMRRA
jgi:hypothetical protein